MLLNRPCFLVSYLFERPLKNYSLITPYQIRKLLVYRFSYLAYIRIYLSQKQAYLTSLFR